MKIAKPKPGKPITGSRDSKKYTDFRANDKSGRNGTVGKKPEGQYSMGVGPRVGGSVTPSGSVASGNANKKMIKRSLGNIKKTAASPQAKKAARRSLGR